MKKIKRSKKILLFMLLAFIVLGQACRKEIILPAKGTSSLTISDARNYFEQYVQPLKKDKSTISPANLSREDFYNSKTPIWDAAYEKMLSNGSSVKVPIDFSGAHVMVDQQTKATVPMSSLNYLFMYKDSLNVMHVEWVMLKPELAWLNGNRDHYLGKIEVRDWSGNMIKKFSFSNHQPQSMGNNSSKAKLSYLEEAEFKGPDEPICLLIPTGKCTKRGPCQYSCDMCTIICAELICAWPPPDACGPPCEMPDEPGTNPPPLNPNPNPTRPGGGGAYPPDDCGGGTKLPKQPSIIDENSIPLPPCIPTPKKIETVALSILNQILGFLPNSNEAKYLSNNKDVVSALIGYFEANGTSDENIEFGNWVVQYLRDNPNENGVDLIQKGLAVYYTDSEMQELINTMADPVTGNGIELYLILKYKGSKLFELSRFSKAANSIQVGEYTLNPHYDKTGKLVFYAASRLNLNANNGIEYIIRPEQLNNFKNNIEYYTSAASLVYMNGVPDKGMVQMMAGDRISGLLNLWGEALKSPDYWIYLINCFMIEPGNPKVRAAVEEAIPSGAPYTRSTLELGRKMHAEYKLGLADGINTFKEYNKIQGIRPDFVNFNTRTIFELKPNNPRQITAGNSQLAKYKKAFEDKYGGNWTTVLDLY